MGLAEEMRKVEKPSSFEGVESNQETSPEYENTKETSNVELASDNVEEPDKQEKLAAAEQALDKATEQPATAEQRFAETVSKKLINDDLLDVIRDDRKSEFLKAVDKFVIENFYHKQRDKKLDQIGLGKLLFAKLYKPFLDKANRYYFEQEAFVYAGDLLKFFKEQNL